jgi:hypothetical protein
VSAAAVVAQTRITSPSPTVHFMMCRRRIREFPGFLALQCA